jgi:hypothetical protein
MLFHFFYTFRLVVLAILLAHIVKNLSRGQSPTWRRTRDAKNLATYLLSTMMPKGARTTSITKWMDAKNKFNMLSKVLEVHGRGWEQRVVAMDARSLGYGALAWAEYKLSRVLKSLDNNQSESDKAKLTRRMAVTVRDLLAVFADPLNNKKIWTANGHVAFVSENDSAFPLFVAGDIASKHESECARLAAHLHRIALTLFGRLGNDDTRSITTLAAALAVSLPIVIVDSVEFEKQALGTNREHKRAVYVANDNNNNKNLPMGGILVSHVKGSSEWDHDGMVKAIRSAFSEAIFSFFPENYKRPQLQEAVVIGAFDDPSNRPGHDDEVIDVISANNNVLDRVLDSSQYSEIVPALFRSKKEKDIQREQKGAKPMTYSSSSLGWVLDYGKKLARYYYDSKSQPQRKDHNESRIDLNNNKNNKNNNKVLVAGGPRTGPGTLEMARQVQHWLSTVPLVNRLVIFSAIKASSAGIYVLEDAHLGLEKRDKEFRAGVQALAMVASRACEPLGLADPTDALAVLVLAMYKLELRDAHGNLPAHVRPSQRDFHAWLMAKIRGTQDGIQKVKENKSNAPPNQWEIDVVKTMYLPDDPLHASRWAHIDAASTRIVTTAASADLVLLVLLVLSAALTVHSGAVAALSVVFVTIFLNNLVGLFPASRDVVKSEADKALEALRQLCDGTRVGRSVTARGAISVLVKSSAKKAAMNMLESSVGTVSRLLGTAIETVITSKNRKKME